MFGKLNHWQQIGIAISMVWFVGFATHFIQYRLTNSANGTIGEARDICDRTLQSNNNSAILIERLEDRVAQQAENRKKWKACRDDVRELRRVAIRSDSEQILFLLAADLGTITFGWAIVLLGVAVLRRIGRSLT